MDTQRMREIVRGIAETENGPQMLREDPKSLAKKLKLKSHEVAAIFSGDLQLVHSSSNPLAGTTTFTFTTGSTIIGNPARLGNAGRFTRFGANSTTTFTFDTGSTITATTGPSRLEDLAQPELIRVLSQSLADPEFADRLRTFLR